MKVFIVDEAKCSGCYLCQIACKDEHVGNDWSPYAKPQPNSGQFWLKVLEHEHGQIPKVRVEYRPTLCNHCDNCALVDRYPDIVYRREDGLVVINPEKAVGHPELVDACPYEAVYWNEELGIAQKCTGCAHLVDEGKLPHCVDLCDTGGLRFGEEEEFADEIAKAEVLPNSGGMKPRVYYINMPHFFIAGSVYDPKSNEVIIGATATLVMPDGSSKSSETDWLGDFYFRKLDAGKYSLRIEAEGYMPIVKEAIEIEDSLNVGDLIMERA